LVNTEYMLPSTHSFDYPASVLHCLPSSRLFPKHFVLIAAVFPSCSF